MPMSKEELRQLEQIERDGLLRSHVGSQYDRMENLVNAIYEISCSMAIKQQEIFDMLKNMKGESKSK